MGNLHRIQWIDTQIRMSMYPNTRKLSVEFEISRTQAQRDFEYLRDSLGAPLVYCATNRGYYYTDEKYVIPGPYLSKYHIAILKRFSDYFSSLHCFDKSITEEIAYLFQRLSIGHEEKASLRPKQLSNTSWDIGVPYTVVLKKLNRKSTPVELSRFIIKEDGDLIICQFYKIEELIGAMISSGRYYKIMKPEWLKNYCKEYLESFIEKSLE